jgi:hypothetical protein
LLRGNIPNPKQLDTRDIVDDFMKAVSNTPDPDEKREVQDRSWFSDFVTILGDFLRRDVTPV